MGVVDLGVDFSVDLLPFWMRGCERFSGGAVVF